MTLQPGNPAPAFQLTASVSGRNVSPEALKGKRVVLVFHGPKTTDAPKEVGKAVRAKHMGTDLVVANVVDLHTMGGMWRRVAEAQVKSTYEKLAGKIRDATPAADPADYVVICPDWENAVAPRFGVPEPDSEPGVAVIGADGRMVGVAVGKGMAEAAVKMLG